MLKNLQHNCECCHRNLLQCSQNAQAASDLDIWCDDEDVVKQPHQAINPNINPPAVSMAISAGSSFLPMEFIQVLIHQHAKTLVALKTLRSEVATLTKPPTSFHTHLPLPPQLDSGLFSTKNNSHHHGDQLFSLLSQIEDRVSSLKQSTNNNKKTWALGHLDDVCGNLNFDFTKFKRIDKAVVKAVLGCDDVGELKRQVLFLSARVESLQQPSPQQQQQPPQQQQPKNNNNNNNNNNKSLTSFPSQPQQYKSLIPIPIARSKKKSPPQQPTQKFLWGQWFN